MVADADFLAKLSTDPLDDTTRLVYADWLDEQGDPLSIAKAEFLRLTVRLATPTGRKGWRKARRKRLQQLAAALDTDWLAVVSQLGIENCSRKREEGVVQRVYAVRFQFLCDRRWEDLQPTEERAVRFCTACQQNVHYCDTITEARRHAHAGHCIAVDLGVIRRDGDLEPPRFVLGFPTREYLRREQELSEPDPVSAERERRKREKSEQAAGEQAVQDH